MIIAIANQKGGVGKTATAVTLAHGAARSGRSVLLVDLDPQGNIADSLGLETGNELIDTLQGRVCHILARPFLQVIRSDKNTAAYKAVLSARDYREYIIQETIGSQHYDLILLDCAPSIDVLHVAALTAADYLLIPTRLDQFSAKGILEILRTMTAANRRGAGCKLAGILPTFYDQTTLETRVQLENLAAHFHGQLWPAIPTDTQVRAANRAGKTLWEYAPATRAVTGIEGNGGYQSALDRILSLA